MWGCKLLYTLVVSNLLLETWKMVSKLLDFSKKIVVRECNWDYCLEHGQKLYKSSHEYCLILDYHFKRTSQKRSARWFQYIVLAGEQFWEIKRGTEAATRSSIGARNIT